MFPLELAYLAIFKANAYLQSIWFCVCSVFDSIKRALDLSQVRKPDAYNANEAFNKASNCIKDYVFKYWHIRFVQRVAARKCKQERCTYGNGTDLKTRRYKGHVEEWGQRRCQRRRSDLREWFKNKTDIETIPGHISCILISGSSHILTSWINNSPNLCPSLLSFTALL